ncbi:ATP-dependent RNA helicase RhlE [Rhizobiales bacterium GAS191]|nr:ATP-dependent RNA helicase RhlE [Rhizobiales bacterium GAS191]
MTNLNELGSFNELGLAAPLLKALAAENYLKPTPIQSQAIPHVLAAKDLQGIAQTGTGKTAAFALPILQRLAAAQKRPEARSCRALILSPTRELASQIAESFRTYGRHMNLTTAAVFGGVSIRPQTEKLSRGVDVLVATPGRLLDHLDSRTLRLDQVEIFVLDEADQMLDMGFIHAIRRITPKLPRQRQSLFFSATMPRDIATLAGELLRDPVKVSVTPVATTADKVDQRVIFVETSRKRALLADILQEEEMTRTLVFTRTKHGADRVVRHLEDEGIGSAAIHGNKSQSQRERALESFKSGRTRVLVATDIAARGIDIDAVSHVVNFDLPNVPESYVHRIGRTARAGAAGIAISFCDAEEKAFLRDIEKLIRKQLPTSGSIEAGSASHAGAARPAGRHMPARPQQDRPHGHAHGQQGGQARHGRRPGQQQGKGQAQGSSPAQGNQGRQAQGQQGSSHQGHQPHGKQAHGHHTQGRQGPGQQAHGQQAHGRQGQGKPGQGKQPQRWSGQRFRPQNSGR